MSNQNDIVPRRHNTNTERKGLEGERSVVRLCSTVETSFSETREPSQDQEEIIFPRSRSAPNRNALVRWRVVAVQHSKGGA
jgi:hypothetical protein